jgi:isoleucyl-tRNA synthetase
MFGQDSPVRQNVTPMRYPHPYRNCIVLGLMLGEDGQKMSKQKRNYREPQEIFDRYGADALRWYFFANQAPWTSIRYSERAIKESIPEFLLRLWNVFSFFIIYANIDGFDPAQRLTGRLTQLTSEELSTAQGYRPASRRNELDRWILSELNRTCQGVVESMDAYDNFAACGQLNAYVDGLSNWYVRRGRDRYWSSDKQSPDKLDAYWTLYECLLTTAKLIAPFTPFLAEHLWRQLTEVFGGRVIDSVHLCDYPLSDPTRIDGLLSQQMELVREISSLGRSARMNAKLKVRQPLAKVEVILVADTHREWLQQHAALIRDELNVKEVEFTQQADEYITYQVQPNFKRLGPRVSKLMPQVKQALLGMDGRQLLGELKSTGRVRLTFGAQTLELDEEDVQIGLQAKAGWAAAQGPHCVVVLSTELTDELIREGFARDIVRIIGEQRKKQGCDFTDRINVRIATRSAVLSRAVIENQDFIMGETLAVRLSVVAEGDGETYVVGADEMRVKLDVEPA